MDMTERTRKVYDEIYEMVTVQEILSEDAIPYILKALQFTRQEAFEECAKKAKKFCEEAGCNSINLMGNNVSKAIRSLSKE